MRTFDLYSPVVFELKPKLPHFQIDSVHWDNKVVRHCPINNFPCLQHFFAALYQQHNGSVRQNSRAILWMMPSKKYLAEKKRGKMAPDGTLHNLIISESQFVPVPYSATSLWRLTHLCVSGRLLTHQCDIASSLDGYKQLSIPRLIWVSR